MSFLIPFRWITHTVGDTFALDAFVELSLTQLDEEATETCLAVGEIIYGETF